ncbi:MAG TPA: hypothetical protein ENI16_00220 [Candidatus Portnoybacteria bacterium]|nr:hypothetical protein [Candidatus Portnoybacteria bacterium]
MKRLVLIGLIGLVSGCAVGPRIVTIERPLSPVDLDGNRMAIVEQESILEPVNEDPGLGVLVNRGNCWLDIKIYRREHSLHSLIGEIELKPAFLGRSFDVRGSRRVQVNTVWLRLEPGYYKLKITPYKSWLGQKVPFRRPIYRSFRINSNPTDEVFSRQYVGWVKKFNIRSRGTRGIKLTIGN